MKKRILAVWVLICTLMCACGNAGQAGSKDAAAGGTPVLEEQWTLKDKVLPDGNGALKELVEELYSEDVDADTIVSGYTREIFVSLHEDTVYRYLEITDGIYVQYYCIQSLESPYTEWKNQVIPVQKGQYLHWLGETTDGNCLLPGGELHQLWIGQQVQRRVISTDGTYEVNDIMVENAEALDDKVEKWYFYQDKDYAYTSEGLVCFQDDFSVSETVAHQNAMFIMQMAETPSGEGLYLYGVPEDGMGMAIWSAEESAPVIREEIGCIIARSKMAFATETEGYLCDINTLWQFSVSDGTIEELEEFQTYGIYGLDDIRALSTREDGTLFVLAAAKDGYHLIERSQRQVADKKTLELAVMIADQYLKEAVVLFNNSNEEYEIVLRERGDEYYEDYNMRIQAEISGGGGPDLIDAAILNLEACAAKGFLVDLTEAFAEEQEDMIEKVMQCGMVDGKQYAIPYLFQIMTLIAGENSIGDRTGWTLEEAMELAGENDVEVMIAYTDSATLFRNLGFWNENNPQLIDWSAGESKLNSPEAMELLTFSKTYGDDRTVEGDYQAALAEGDIFFDSNLRLMRGEALTGLCPLYDINNLAYYENLFRIYNDKLVLIGFPAENGKRGHSISCFDIAVNQACEYPEGAIAFLHFLQSEDLQQKLVEHRSETVPGFPVRRDALNQIFERAKQGEYGLDKIWLSGEGIDAEPMSEEVIDRLWQLIEEAEPASRRMEQVLIMMDEETMPYFTGDRTAQEALDVLQNRVQLYMDETR